MKQAKQSVKWDFPVHQEVLKTSRGVSSGIHAVINGDTGECVGQYRGQKLVPNRQVVDIFESELGKQGIAFTASHLTTANGGRYFGRYKLHGLEVKGIMGEKFNGLLTLQNSYNGSLKIGFEAGLERLLCLNGMRGMSHLFAMFKRHSENVDTAFVSEQVQHAVAGFETLEREFAKLADISLTYQQGVSVLANLTKLNKYPLSARMAQKIAGNWAAPTDDEKPLGDTMYRLYNAGTRCFRDLESNRFELANRSNGMFTEQFLLAANNQNVLTQLCVPATFEKN